MENKERMLDLTGGWESIVNNVERHNARVRFEKALLLRKNRKLRRKVVDLSLGAVLVVALSAAGLLAPWVAGVASVLLICGASVIVGRLLERRKQV